MGSRAPAPSPISGAEPSGVAIVPGRRRARSALCCAAVRVRRLALLAVIALAGSGCATYIGRARRDYNEGRYLEAAEKLANHRDDVPDLPPRKQIELATILGLSLLQMGDAPGARRWLEYADGVARDFPDEVRPEIGAMLARGLRDVGLGRPRGDAPIVAPAKPLGGDVE